MVNKKEKKTLISLLTPTRIIVLGFILLILLGTTLLHLPISSNSGEYTNYLDAFFTATSAICVTGLVVVNTLEHWSVFGQIVIMCMIQIGGLGVVTFVTLVFMLTKKKITLKERLIIQESLNQSTFSGMVVLVKRIFFVTLLFEGIAAVILGLRFANEYGFFRGLFMGIFISISAFCNAGFDIIGDSSLTPYVGDVLVNLVVMSLIIFGGLGFTVWIDIFAGIKDVSDKKIIFKSMLKKFKTHTKVVLIITSILILVGAVLIFIFEYGNGATLKDEPFSNKVLASFMQSVTARTAGFNSIDQAGMSYGSKFVTILLMFIGGSSAGTAGGIKTSTVGVLFFTVISVIKGSNKTEIFGRTIPFETLQKALAVFFISFLSVIFFTVLLSVTEKNSLADFQFLDIFFETVSALGTAGISTGVTPNLSYMGKLIICLCMFMGRLGPITIVMALTRKQNQHKNNLEYPEGKVMVG